MSTVATVDRDTLLTAGQFAAWDDMAGDQLYELVEGRLLHLPPPMFDHGECEAAIVAALRMFARSRKLGRVSSGEVRILTRRNPDTVRLADVVYISHERFVGQDVHSTLAAAPDLVVEVVSPGDAWSEVLEKTGEYLDMGVRLVWIVLPRLRQVYVYRSLTEVRIFTENDTLDGADVLPGFTLPVAEIFDE